MGEMYNDSKHFSIGSFYTNYWCRTRTCVRKLTKPGEFGFGLRFDDLLLANDALEFKASYFDTKAKDYISTTVDFAAATTMSYNVPNAKIWGWDMMATYATSLFNWTWPTTARAGKIPTRANTSPASTRTPSPASWISRWRKADSPWAGSAPSSNVQRTSAAATASSPGYAVNDFYVSYKGQQQFKGITTTLVLGNAFDKALLVTAGHPAGWPQRQRSSSVINGNSLRGNDSEG